MKIALASISPRRKTLLKKIVPHFRVISPQCREYHFKTQTPIENVRQNAYRKALAGLRKAPDSLIISADTVVVLGKEILGKPRSNKEAQTMLCKLSGKMHRVITGVAMISRGQEIRIIFHVTTNVRMKKLKENQICRYLKSIHVLDKAGAYGIQEKPKIVERIQGSYTNVVGLPVERLRKELKKIIRGAGSRW